MGGDADTFLVVQRAARAQGRRTARLEESSQQVISASGIPPLGF